MEILTPAIQHDNKNIRVYWNIDKRTVVLIITNLEDNKRVKCKDYPPLVYSSTNDYEDVDKFQQMFARDIRGKSNAFFGLNIGMDNANKLANALINYSDMHHVLGRTKEANEVLDEIDNKEFAHIFQEVQQEIEKDGLEDPTPNDQPHVETSSNTTEVYNNGLGKTPKDNFKDYIDQYHKNELRNINEGVELPQTIVIDWQELKEFDKELANMLISKAEDTLELMQNGLLELTTNRALDIDEDVKIRFDNLEVTPTKQLLANKIGQMVQTEGIIKGILEPSFYYTTAVFECKEGHGAIDLVVVLQRTDIVILGQRFLQPVLEAVVGRLADPQHVHAVAVQAVAEEGAGAREIGGNKDIIQNHTSCVYGRGIIVCFQRFVQSCRRQCICPAWHFAFRMV